jgi:formimidoylglutamate deiminase
VTQATVWFETALLPQGWAKGVRLTLADGLIAQVAVDTLPAAGEERRGPALPGGRNVHSHAFQRGMAGLAEVRGPKSDSFWTWRALMYRFVDKLDPDDIEALAALAYVEMLEAGFTRVGEFHYLHHDVSGRPYADLAETGARVVAAAAQTGIGLTLLPVFYAQSGFGGRPPELQQRRFINDLDGYLALREASRAAIAVLPDAVLGAAPHSLRAVTPEALQGMVTACPDGPIHIHIAEQVKEVRDCMAWSGRRPVEWLYHNLEIDGRWCLVHATHLTADELALIAKSQAVAGLCPITEANLGDGLFPAPKFLELGGRFGVGSDSNVMIDLSGEFRTLEYGHRIARRSRNTLAEGPDRSTGGRLYRDALVGGAQAVGEVGPALEVGAVADIVALDPNHASMIARSGDACIDSWVFAGGRGAVDAVWRRGRRVVEGGRHIKRDEIVTRYRATLERVLVG